VFLWRISNHLSLAGDGALRTPGRWHSRGRRVVYCAQTPAAALLEILVHFEIDIQDLPIRYRLLKIEAPDDVPVGRVSVDDLPANWTLMGSPSWARPCGPAIAPSVSLRHR
jgi:RES domain-containing protein